MCKSSRMYQYGNARTLPLPQPKARLPWSSSKVMQTELNDRQCVQATRNPWQPCS